MRRDAWLGGLVFLGWSLACGGVETSDAPSDAPVASDPGGGGGGRGGGRGGRRGGRRNGGDVPAPAPAPSGGGGVCYAQGRYEACVTEDGVEQCTDNAADGAGVDAADAIANCTDHLTNMVIMGNYPSGSPGVTNRADVTRACAVTHCDG